MICDTWIHDTWYLILSDTWYMILDIWYLRHDTWEITLVILDIWYLMYNTWYLILYICYLIYDTWYLILDSDNQYQIHHISYLISDTLLLKPWYLHPITCYLLLANCYLSFDTYWNMLSYSFYMVLVILSLLLLAKRLFPFAPVVRLALALNWTWLAQKKLKVNSSLAKTKVWPMSAYACWFYYYIWMNTLYY